MSAGQATARVALRDAKAMGYVARQPIFDRHGKVFGYEPRFRDSLENCFAGDADEASRATLDRSLVIGLDVLCAGQRAFVNRTRMLQEVLRPELDVPGLEKLIKEEASMCYRLLRDLNSAVFGFKKEIHSVRHALFLLGERDLRRWVRLIGSSGGTRQDQRPGTLRAGPGAVLRIARAESTAWRIGQVPDGAAIFDRCRAGNTDGDRSGEDAPWIHQRNRRCSGSPVFCFAYFSGCWRMRAAGGRRQRH